MTEDDEVRHRHPDRIWTSGEGHRHGRTSEHMLAEFRILSDYDSLRIIRVFVGYVAESKPGDLQKPRHFN
jgi:hypothetical protein